MRYHALALDFDGTLAREGTVSEKHIAAIEKLKASGRKVVLVTGRRLADLTVAFPRINLFDRIVSENGACLYNPDTRKNRLLCPAPLPALIAELRKRQVKPLDVGSGIVATRHPHESTVLNVIRDLGLELEVIFNRGAVMILPTGINKATGLLEALKELSISAHNTVAAGDGENDHALLSVAECSVAVANAIDSIKQRADYVTDGECGEGIAELIQRLLASDLKELEPLLSRHHVPIGTSLNGTQIDVSPYQTAILICGPSSSGKSTAVGSLLEQLIKLGYQFCLVDPEGDYEQLASAIGFGDSSSPPTIDECTHTLRTPDNDVVLNLLAMAHEERPEFFIKLMPRLQELKTTTGRPHWIIVDEAHYLMPASMNHLINLSPEMFRGLILVTVHPDRLAPSVLSALDVIIATGDNPAATIANFCHTTGEPEPLIQSQYCAVENQAIIWFRKPGLSPQVIQLPLPQLEHHRHLRKYAEGDLGAYHSFYFTGPSGRLNLKAQNLIIFNHILEGIDDETWLYHLHNHDYSRWLKGSVRDNQLAAIVQAIESNRSLSSQITRAQIKSAIETRYCAPV